MFEKLRTRSRHRALMTAACRLVMSYDTRAATPADLAAFVFGRHQIDLDEQEAARYLAAARVEHGYLDSLDTDTVLAAVQEAPRPELPLVPVRDEMLEVMERAEDPQAPRTRPIGPACN
ncbi:hypothetical protein [Streptomyces sp. NPDC053720]|uniref:hypothetical protein n=1 Tax=Streptomyces sp. NPDC053720 TaxID=3154855 RepID=UPI00343722D4